MRNDLQDEPKDIPSLIVDDDEHSPSIEAGNTVKISTKQVSSVGSSHKSHITLFFLLLICVIAIIALFVMGKRSIDHIQRVLNDKSQATSSLNQTATDQLQKLSEQLVNQQGALTSRIETIHKQINQLADKVAELSSVQQKIISKQETQEKYLATLEGKVASLAKDTHVIEQLKKLAEEVKTLKEQNLVPTIKSIQDDLLLLRVEVDKTNQKPNESAIQTLQADVKQQLQAMQEKIELIQNKLNSIPY